MVTKLTGLVARYRLFHVAFGVALGVGPKRRGPEVRGPNIEAVGVRLGTSSSSSVDQAVAIPSLGCLRNTQKG